MFGLEKDGDPKIPRLESEKQVQVFLDYYDLDPEKDGEDDEHTKVLTNSAKRLVRHIMAGRVEVVIDDDKDGDLKVTQHLQCRRPGGQIETLEYKVVEGSAKRQMKNADEKDHIGKIYSVAASLCGTSINAISKIRGVDLSAVECLGVLFLAV